MQNKVVLFTIMCILISCSVHIATVPPKYEGVKLTIDTPENITDGFITINVSLENNTIHDFYIIDKRYFDIPSNTCWGLEIISQDTKQIVRRSVLINHGVVRRTDYVFIESGHTYTFQLSVDFTELCNSLGYGKYSIKLNYYDSRRYRLKAFKGKIESNVRKVLYEP